MQERPPEFFELERLIASAGTSVEVQTLCEIEVDGHHLPVNSLSIGNPAPDVPAVGFFGGVHGLERIGTQVVLGYLQSLIARLRWDSVLHKQLQDVRLIFIPMVNPGGFLKGTRANPNGVDLMRNSPVEAGEKVPRLLGGQRLSSKLPWYRGTTGVPMEAESAAMCEFVQRELLGRRFSLALDCHSGFGIADRIWFPYAHTAQPIAHIAEIYALGEILDQGQLHHRYVVEPQSKQYLTHGDLWDFLYMRSLERPANIFLPLTLEMGSWRWIKKNMGQLFSPDGMFNPMITHRQQRVVRRHAGLLDFLARAASGHALWLPVGDARKSAEFKARRQWYGSDDSR